MSKIRLFGDSSGYMEIAPPAAGSSATVTLPNSAGEILLSDGSAASLTQIPAANIVGVCTAGLGNASGAFSQGITEMDQWRITSQYSGGGAITANLERNDSPGYDKIGTGMSHSSGVFTFPSTGVWLVSMSAEFQIASDSDRAARAEISVTTNNSSYTNYTLPGTNMYQSSGSTYGTTYAQQIIDCTDTSQVKVKFSTSVVNSSTITRGESTVNYTYFTFIRLGDT